MPEYSRPSDGSILRNSGCCSSNGSCPSCPNQPKSPSEWWYSFGPCTQLLLAIIFVTSAVGNYIIDPIFPSLIDREGGDMFLSEREMTFRQLVVPTAYDSVVSDIINPYFPPWLLTTLTGFIRVFTWPIRLLFDFGAPISLGFLFTFFILSLSLDKVERAICGEYLTEVFKFPGHSLFTEVTLPNGVYEEKNNILVRSLRMIWLYTVMLLTIYGLGVLWGLTETVVCGVVSILCRVFGIAMTIVIGSDGKSDVGNFLIIGKQHNVSGDGISFSSVALIISRFIFAVAPRILHSFAIISRPTEGMIICLTTIWCFLEPPNSVMKIPFASLFSIGSSSGNTAQSSSSENVTTDDQRRPLSRNVDPKTGLKKEASTVAATVYPFILVGIHLVMSLIGWRGSDSHGVSSRLMPVTIMSIAPDLFGLLIGYELAFMVRPNNRYQIPKWFVVGRDIVCVVLEGLLAMLLWCSCRCTFGRVRHSDIYDDNEYQKRKRDILNKMSSNNKRVVEKTRNMSSGNNLSGNYINDMNVNHEQVTENLHEDIVTTLKDPQLPTTSKFSDQGLSVDAVERIWVKSKSRRGNITSFADYDRDLSIKKDKKTSNFSLINTIYSMIEQTRNTSFIPYRDLEVPLIIYVTVKRYNVNRYKKMIDRGHLTPWGK